MSRNKWLLILETQNINLRIVSKDIKSYIVAVCVYFSGFGAVCQKQKNEYGYLPKCHTNNLKTTLAASKVISQTNMSVTHWPVDKLYTDPYIHYVSSSFPSGILRVSFHLIIRYQQKSVMLKLGKLIFVLFHTGKKKTLGYNKIWLMTLNEIHCNNKSQLVMFLLSYCLPVGQFYQPILARQRYIDFSVYVVRYAPIWKLVFKI